MRLAVMCAAVCALCALVPVARARSKKVLPRHLENGDILPLFVGKDTTPAQKHFKHVLKKVYTFSNQSMNFHVSDTTGKKNRVAEPTVKSLRESLKSWRQSLMKDLPLECLTAMQQVTSSVVHKSCGFPDRPYPNDFSATWQIEAPAGKKIQLLFSSFDVEAYPRCGYDSLTVYEGDMASPGTKLGSYCGEEPGDRKAPRRVVSTGNKLRLVFRTDSSVRSSGFAFTPIFVDQSETPVWPDEAPRPDCGPEMLSGNATPTLISSPGSPNNYPTYMTCVYKLEVDSGYLKLGFNDFALEECGNNCACDSVRIYPDHDARTPSHIFCGEDLPSDMVSMTNRLKVEFRSDFSRSARGFKVFFQSVPQPPVQLPPIAGRAQCGGVYQQATGVVHSPGYDVRADYFDNAECEWLLKPNMPGDCIELDFTSLHIEDDGEPGSNCPYDRLLIYNHVTDTSPSHVLCGYITPEPIVVGSEAKVLFETDGSVTEPGFEAIWTAGHPCPANLPPPLVECGGRLDTATGDIRSPTDAAGEYGDLVTCEWHLELTQGSEPQKVHMSFPEFEVESCWGCECDRLEIFDGLEATVPSEVFCGDLTPDPLILEATTLKVRFVTDYSVGMSGFELHWEKQDDCREMITSVPAEIESTKYGELNYPNNADCMWTVTVPGQNALVTISDLELEECGNVTCVCDRLEIYDSPSSLLPEHVICGHRETPLSIITPGPTVSIRFISDYSITGRGFSLTVDTSPDPYVDHGHKRCTDVLTAVSGYLSAPTVNGAYADHNDCVWLIEAPASPNMEFVRLEFTSFEVERCGDLCLCDKVEIYDRATDLEPLLTLCGGLHNIPPVIVSQTSQMKIRFVTDYSITRAGFAASWTLTTQAPPPGPPRIPPCRYSYIAAPGGVVSSLYYDGTTEYPDHLDCEYLIEAPPKKGIRLIVQNFDLEYSSDCIWDSLEVIAYNTVPGNGGPPSPGPGNNGSPPNPGNNGTLPNTQPGNPGSPTGPRSGPRYCGGLDNLPTTMNFTNNRVLLKFNTDYSIGATGFQILYELL